MGEEAHGLLLRYIKDTGIKISNFTNLDDCPIDIEDSTNTWEYYFYSMVVSYSTKEMELFGVTTESGEVNNGLADNVFDLGIRGVWLTESYDFDTWCDNLCIENPNHYDKVQYEISRVNRDRLVYLLGIEDYCDLICIVSQIRDEMLGGYKL